MKTLKEQYDEARSTYPDKLLLMRMGDFYEFFYQDAETASRLLGLTLTTRTDYGDVDSRIPMCGFPYHQLTKNLDTLKADVRLVVVIEKDKVVEV